MPQGELNAMREFFGGKKCVISNTTSGVNWCHILDAALDPGPSNKRLAEMLDRKLRKNPCPSHAAELRENVVPTGANFHAAMDQDPPAATLFPHEDVLARTLAYEQDLQNWRIAELEAGRDDPGRPEYNEVFGGTPVIQHRFHCARVHDPVMRVEGANLVNYYSQDCPGIDDPTSQQHFPIINALLSTPFSLLHNLPRLTAILPFTTHQQRLILMGVEIIYLWWWDPSPELIGRIRNRKLASKKDSDTPRPKPHPIHHPSRMNTTFSTKRSTTTFDAHTPPNQDRRAADRHLDSIVLGAPIHPDWSADGMWPTDHEGPTKEDLQHVDYGTMAGVTGSPVTNEAWTEFKDSDHINDITAVQDKPPTCPSSSDIVSWSQEVVNPGSELPLPSASPAPFERGVIASMSANDVLMVKGLVNPSVYLQFFDLSLFSRL